MSPRGSPARPRGGSKALEKSTWCPRHDCVLGAGGRASIMAVSPGRSHRTLGSRGLGTWFNALYILEVLKFCIPFGPGILQFQFASCVAGSGQW